MAKRQLSKAHPRVAFHRRNAAKLAREIRAMWPGLAGDWSRRDWNQQAMRAAENHVAGMLRFDRANQPEVLV